MSDILEAAGNVVAFVAAAIATVGFVFLYVAVSLAPLIVAVVVGMWVFSTCFGGAA